MDLIVLWIFLLTVNLHIFDNPRFEHLWLLVYAEKGLIWQIKTHGCDRLGLHSLMDWQAQLIFIKGLFGFNIETVLEDVWVVVLVLGTTHMA